jgi:hypothetical protein
VVWGGGPVVDSYPARYQLWLDNCPVLRVHLRFGGTRPGNDSTVAAYAAAVAFPLPTFYPPQEYWAAVSCQTPSLVQAAHLPARHSISDFGVPPLTVR